MSDTDESVDRLYGLPLDEFTQARNQLAQELKRAGDEEGAARVKKLQKPSVSAWAVNQLSRSRPDDLNGLLEVQSSLADAGSATQVRELTEQRRDLVARLVKSAEAILTAEGHGSGSDTVQKISRTLLAGSTGDDAELLRRGRLSRDLASAGFDQVFGFTPEEGEDDEAGVDERARHKAQQLAAEADALEQQTAELEGAAKRLREQTEEAEARAAAARSRAEKARAKAEAAWEKLG